MTFSAQRNNVFPMLSGVAKMVMVVLSLFAASAFEFASGRYFTTLNHAANSSASIDLVAAAMLAVILGHSLVVIGLDLMLMRGLLFCGARRFAIGGASAFFAICVHAAFAGFVKLPKRLAEMTARAAFRIKEITHWNLQSRFRGQSRASIPVLSRLVSF